MDTHDFSCLRVERDGARTTVTLDKPTRHNAFDAALMTELGRVFTALSTDSQTRVVVLEGEGPSFCAGADINWMRASIDYSRQQNVEDATRMALMMETIFSCSKPVVCRVHGKAIGGGLGLICAADYVVAADDAIFCFSEVKLGIVPAVISPFVIRRIGSGHARALFVSGERFGAERALRTGLVHTVVPAGQLDEEVDRVVGEMMTSAPDAMAIAKTLVFDIAYQKPGEALSRTVETIATKRTDPEGQEGLSAFLEKRAPSWANDVTVGAGKQ